MSKIRLIIQREYLTRVRRRSFILATLLTPLGFGVFLAVVQLIFGYESDDMRRIIVVDQGDLLDGALADEQNVYFQIVQSDVETIRRNFNAMQYDGILVLPPPGDPLRRDYRVYFYSDEKLTLDVEAILQKRLDQALRRYKIEALDLQEEALSALDARIEVTPRPITEGEGTESTLAGAVAAAFGVVMGLVMYITVFVYGMMVMRSVMEEKTSRIVEVMISSVRPFPLMLGKIIGVGAVGLTQVAVWALLLPVMLLVVNLFFGFQSPPPEFSSGVEAMDPRDAEALLTEAIAAFYDLNWWIIVPLFILYFLGGYFMYAALFAAVGSAMGDDLGEGQSLTIPITIPVVLAFYIMIASIQAPNSSMAVFSSLFPLFSPIVMPARLPFEPPWWEVAISILLLLASAGALVWLSGRIYRIGILTYGKKTGLRQLARWLFIKD